MKLVQYFPQFSNFYRFIKFLQPHLTRHTFSIIISQSVNTNLYTPIFVFNQLLSLKLTSAGSMRILFFVFLWKPLDFKYFIPVSSFAHCSSLWEFHIEPWQPYFYHLAQTSLKITTQFDNLQTVVPYPYFWNPTYLFAFLTFLEHLLMLYDVFCDVP